MITQARFLGGAKVLSSGTIAVGTLRRHRVLVIPSDAGFSAVTLPDARRIPLGGPIAFIVNQSSSNADVKDSTGATIQTMEPGDTVKVLLSSHSTAAGHWRFLGNFPLFFEPFIYADNVRVNAIDTRPSDTVADWKVGTYNGAHDGLLIKGNSAVIDRSVMDDYQQVQAFYTTPLSLGAAYRIKCTVKIPGLYGGTYAGIIFRADLSSFTNYTMFEVNRQDCRFHESDGGGIVGTSYSFPVALTEALHDIEVRVDGSIFTGYVDGVQVLQVSRHVRSDKVGIGFAYAYSKFSSGFSDPGEGVQNYKVWLLPPSSTTLTWSPWWSDELASQSNGHYESNVGLDHYSDATDPKYVLYSYDVASHVATDGMVIVIKNPGSSVDSVRVKARIHSTNSGPIIELSLGDDHNFDVDGSTRYRSVTIYRGSSTSATYGFTWRNSGGGFIFNFPNPVHTGAATNDFNITVTFTPTDVTVEMDEYAPVVIDTPEGNFIGLTGREGLVRFKDPTTGDSSSISNMSVEYVV